MDTNSIDTSQIVVFAILMEGNGGILDKSPKYIQEKFHSCMNEPEMNHLLGLLDENNQIKAREWRRRWMI